MEKQNKAARQRRKKEEVTRIRTLVGITPYMAVCLHVHPPQAVKLKMEVWLQSMLYD